VPPTGASRPAGKRAGRVTCRAQERKNKKSRDNPQNAIQVAGEVKENERGGRGKTGKGVKIGGPAREEQVRAHPKVYRKNREAPGTQKGEANQRLKNFQRGRTGGEIEGAAWQSFLAGVNIIEL